MARLPPTVTVTKPATPEAGELRLTFAQLYDLYFSFVWRTAHRLGTPRASVDDVAQEVFIVVHRRYPHFQARASVKTWIFAILRNVVRSHRRSLLKKNPHALHADSSVRADEVEDLHSSADTAQAEAGRLVNRLLTELDDDKREVFVLAELEEMSAPEIAHGIGVPLNTVYSRLRLARQEFAAAAARHRARDDWRSK